MKWEYECIVTCLKASEGGPGGIWATLNNSESGFELRVFFEKTDWSVGQKIKVYVQTET